MRAKITTGQDSGLVRLPSSRRSFLQTSAGLTAVASLGLFDLACGGERRGDVVPRDPRISRTAAPLSPTPECLETEENILGPYYRAGAPFRTNLVDAETVGSRLTLSGRVLGEGCATTLSGALIDLWQADDDGHYDNDPSSPPPAADEFVLRGKTLTSATGGYRFETIIPGPYLNGAQYRPSHIHVTLSAPGYVTLTTQLYFEGDPYIPIDPFVRESLVMKLTDIPGGQAATFDFVLRKDV